MFQSRTALELWSLHLAISARRLVRSSQTGQNHDRVFDWNILCWWVTAYFTCWEWDISKYYWLRLSSRRKVVFAKDSIDRSLEWPRLQCWPRSPLLPFYLGGARTFGERTREAFSRCLQQSYCIHHARPWYGHLTADSTPIQKKMLTVKKVASM